MQRVVIVVAALVGAVAVVGLIAVWPSAPVEARPRPAPLPAWTPTEQITSPRQVRLSLDLLQFGSFNEAESSYDVTGSIYTTWRDPALISPTAPATRRLTAPELWTPRLVILNATEVRRDFETDYTVRRDGVVEHEFRFRARMPAVMDVRSFPFDNQVFEIIVASSEFSGAELTFAPSSDVSLQPGAELREWRITSITSTTYLSPLDTIDLTWAAFAAELSVSRNAAFWLWRVFLPLTLFVIIAWTASWIDPKQIDPQNAAAIAALLITVTFSFTIGGQLPRVSYLTFYDGYNLICISFIALTLMFIGLAHALEIRNRAPNVARFSRFAGKYLLPVYFIVMMVVNYIYFIALPAAGLNTFV